MNTKLRKATDRELAIEEDINSPYLWCLHCERTYTRGEYRTINLDGQYLEMCPYEDCDGDTVIDAWPWETILEKHPEYPEIPERDKYYPMY